jgi:predicted nuclease of restriction endonuclease-like (RecB) superfamily
MMAKPAKRAGRSEGTTAALPIDAAFGEVVLLIRNARQHAARVANAAVIELYWRIGQYLHHRIEADGWAKGTVVQLAAYIAQREPGRRGFSAQNLWRMRQFFLAYPSAMGSATASRLMSKGGCATLPVPPRGASGKAGLGTLSTLLREVSWSSHLHILSRTRRAEEREFYLRMTAQQGWQVREVARQIDSGLFERALLDPPRLSTALRDSQPQAERPFKDVYLLEFLALPDPHTEADLHRGLLLNLGRFLNELGRDFCYVGSEFPLQVGGQDFVLDLLFFHRGLNCLVAVELKVTAFQPEHLGKLNFYLEALDRDLKKPHENPAIGLLLCASKDSEVVEYALSRTLSPALVAQYQTQLPDKQLLAAKLHEFYALSALDAVPADAAPRLRRKRASAT